MWQSVQAVDRTEAAIVVRGMAEDCQQRCPEGRLARRINVEHGRRRLLATSPDCEGMRFVADAWPT
jgi:hypothetical protein